MNKEEIQKIISDKDFDKFIGQIENDWVDFKTSPYILKTNRQKGELAKDVSSFANSKGGFLLIGFKTGKIKTGKNRGKEEVLSVNPIPENLVDIEQYEGIINDWICPRIEYDISWEELDSTLNKGIVIIQIPEQERFPFLVTKALDGEKIIGNLFGHFQRIGDDNLHYNATEMQGFFSLGFHGEESSRGTRNPEKMQERADEARTDDSLPEKK